MSDPALALRACARELGELAQLPVDDLTPAELAGLSARLDRIADDVERMPRRISGVRHA